LKLEGNFGYLQNSFTNTAIEKKTQRIRPEKPNKWEQTEENYPVSLSTCKWD
jgi:hypothetical protein